MPRLLRCTDCLLIEVLPEFEGSVKAEAADPYLSYAVAKHIGPVQIERGRRMPPGWKPRHIQHDEQHFGSLLRVTDADWKNQMRREEILRRIWEDQKHTGFEPEYYATRMTFQEDALVCFNRHRRPDQGCIDYKAAAKRLSNPKRKHPIFLCDFCPVQVWVETQTKKAQGAYDE